MSAAHQFVAWAVVVVTILLLGAVAWSVVTSRRAAGERDHRFAVDRLVLAVVVAVAANAALGGVVLATGSRPADPLHLLYGPAALVTLPIGWWLGGRADRRTTGSQGRRARRDLWLLAATLVLLGLELRLFMTG